MQSKKHANWTHLLLLVLCCSLSACRPETQTTIPDPTPAQVVEIITPIATVEQIRTPTIEIEGTSTSLPEVVTTLEPTLTRLQRDQRIQQLMQGDPNCRLPCWWGIEPGTTTWVDAEKYLLQMGFNPSFTRQSEDLIHHEVNFNLDSMSETTINSVGFKEKEGQVTSINVQAASGRDPEQFLALWNHFSPEEILQQYGKPSRIWVQSTTYGRGDFVGYYLWSFYDSQGFLIIYNGVTARKEIYTICPSYTQPDNNTDIFIVLSSPDESIPLKSLSGLYDWVSKPFIKSIEKATSYDIDSFYKAYLEKGSSFCFETPSEIWPASTSPSASNPFSGIIHIAK